MDGLVRLDATLTDAPDSEAAQSTVSDLRTTVRDVDPDALVGGTSAQDLDTQETAARDLLVIVPLVLLVITVVLALLLRAIVAPLLLVATVALSTAATVGVAALAFEHLFAFPGSDPQILLIGFVFLVALGIDYNIFLMTRAREESMRHGTRDGVLRALAVTGGVITSAGLVLAATFGALTVLPLVHPHPAGLPGRLRRPAGHLRRPHPAGAGLGAPHRRQGLVAEHAGDRAVPEPEPERNPPV